MSSHRVLALTLILAAGLAACGGSGTSTTAPGGPGNISGNWNFTGSFSNAGIASSCQVTSSSVTLSQTGNSFTGIFTSGTENCTISGAAHNYSLTGLTFTGGQISGTSVSFVDDGGCTYTGSLSGSPANKMSGNLDCALPAVSAADTLKGTWGATR